MAAANSPGRPENALSRAAILALAEGAARNPLVATRRHWFVPCCSSLDSASDTLYARRVTATQTTEPNPESEGVLLPPGLRHAYFFVAFNALSFQVVLSSPMILFAKSLDATATVLGIVSGMMPLMVVFQIPATSHIARYGYRRFVLAGWGIRVLFIFAMALVPLSGFFLSKSTQLALLLLLLFGFNLSRGISSCGWLPWITSLIPPVVRGKYLARESGFINAASLVAFFLSGACLGNQPGPWQFSLLFAFSATMGAISLTFLKQIPDVPMSESGPSSRQPVPWLAISRFPPFRKLLRFNVAWSLAYGGLNAFAVAFLKTEVGMSEGTILWVGTTAFLGGLGSLWLFGRRLDHLGSRPVVTFALLGWLWILAGWFLLSAKVIEPRFPIIMTLQFLMGLGAASLGMANTRLAMATIPPMGRTHFFALFSVVGNLTLGLAPILWGLLIDALRPLHWVWHGMEWNRFSVFFLAVSLAMLIALGCCRRLDEPAAVGMEALLRDVLIRSPQRFWLRFWPRS